MAQVNGADFQAVSSSASDIDISSILQALEVIHNPTTKNDLRRQASEYLEQLKIGTDAVQKGFILGGDRNQLPLVRHFGLSLLEHVLRHQGHTLDDNQNAHLRQYIIELGSSVQETDPAFVRNKIAELWIELTKRSWALDWYDLDEHLVTLWEQGLVQKEFVLTILENLSEDIFVREDTTAILRGRDLNSALVEIFTSNVNYAGGIKVGDVVHHMRYGSDGWLTRITNFVEENRIHSDVSNLHKTSILKGLATLRSSFFWAMTPSIVHSKCLQTTCNCLTDSDSDIIMAAIDSLLTLYGRTRFEEVEVHALVYPLCQPESSNTLRQVYTWSIVGVDDIDSIKYTISKKLSELISLICDWMTRFVAPESTVLDMSTFLHFMTYIAEHESLIVSIPAVHSWVRLLEMPSWRRSPVIISCIGPLLEMSSQRIIQYDQLADDSEEPAIIFVNDEIEVFPERQGFFVNYRKLCSAVVEWICYAHLEQAISFVLTQVDLAFDVIEKSQEVFDMAGYERISPLSLKADAQFSIVDAAYKGFTRWQNNHRESSQPEIQQFSANIEEKLKSWAVDMLNRRNFKDPHIKHRQIKTAVEISSRALQKDTGFAFNVLEHILSAFIVPQPEYPSYFEAVLDLHSYATNELRRLTLQHVDYFATFYDQLRSKFEDLIASHTIDDKVQVDLKSTLFLIVERASAIELAERQARLWSFLESISSAWNADELQTTLASFETFVQSQAFDQVGPYLNSINAKQLEDWSQISADDKSIQIQRQMAEGYSRLPLRETRILLSISTEKLEQGSDIHKMICELWSAILPSMLGSVLRLASYNHRLHDPSQWPNVSEDSTITIQRVLRDRYWQSGISEGSMQDFHHKIRTSKSSLEGFASSVRGRIRNNLEQCYGIIHTVGRLGIAFYGLPQISEMFAESLIMTAGPLSPHHFAVMLQMLPKVIEECPTSYRLAFLTPIMTALLEQMDKKLTSEWDKLDQRKQTKHLEESLGDEMRDDSVLRQTTYKAVNMLAFWLDPRREQTLNGKRTIMHTESQNESVQSMRGFILSNIHILEPLLLFCTHSLSLKDTKACSTMISTLQRLVPAFSSEQYISGNEISSVREYISTEILKASISSLHDGYFADYQQHFAQLIAVIWLSYGLPVHVPATETHPAHDRSPLTSTTRNILLSLPGMSPEKVDVAATRLLQEGLHGKHKKLRAIILSLLESVRGVRLSELGKIDTRQQASRILEKYKQRESLNMQGIENQAHTNNDSVDLGGVADLFG